MRAPLLARLPLRARLTAAFVVVMAAVLALGGAFVYIRLGDSLDRTITLGLRSRADDLRTQAGSASGALAQGRSVLTERGESIAQRLSASGAVLDATPALRDRALLSPEQRARALAGHEVLVDRGRTTAGDDPVRLLAVRVDGARSQPEVLVVGASTEDRQETLEDARELLGYGVPVVLLLASLAGYALAGAALRPVEQMRRQAEAIQAADSGARLALPPADDEIHRLGVTLNDLLDRLGAAVRVERTFVADASHELRTPLAILKAELEFALRPARTGAERTEALQAAADETDRLVRLAEDLLVIARAQDRALTLRREPLDLGAVAQTVASRHGREAQQRGVKLVVAPPDGPALVDGDRLRLEQALGNLVDNAIAHAASTVTVSIAVHGGEVTVGVADDGDGFPAAFLPHAFERFTRADKARSGGGSGLGLSIVETIAAAHGGQAAAANDPAGGARVSVSLPGIPEGGGDAGSDH